MSLIPRILQGLRGLFARQRVNRELDDEVRFYIEEAAAANRAKGMAPHEALRAARASIGSVSSAQAPAREWGWDVWLETLGQDLRHAIRYLAKAPGFTIAASLSLALGIGANTAIFSMVEAMLIRKFPIARSEEVVTVGSPGSSGVYAYPAFDDVRRAQTSLTGLAAFGPITVSFTEGDASDLVSGFIVTGNYFDVLGVQPARGRLISTSDDLTPGAHPVAVITTALWQSRFGKRRDIVGLNVRLNGQPFTIIGVTPPGFNGTQTGTPRDVYVPMMMQAWMRPPRAGYSGEMNPDLLKVRGNNWLFAVGRLKPGVSVEQATASINTIIRSMGDWTTKDQPAPSVRIARVDDGPPGERAQLKSVAWLLGGVVFVVLIIACANVANLLLARASARRREIAVRLALGATRRRLIRQLLTESVLLASLGGALGLGLAWLTIRGVRASPPPAGALPVALDFALDLRVLAFTFALAVGTGIVFGLMPALRASRPELVPALKGGGYGVWGLGFSGRMAPRKALVVAQVALSLVLLISSGLFIRSLERTRALSPGFDVDHLVTVPLNIQLLRYTRDQGKAFYRDIVDRVGAVPGVASTSLVRWVPLGGGGSSGSLHLEGRGGADVVFQSQGSGFDLSDPGTISNDLVGLKYFETMGIARTKGRDFTEADNESSPPVVIVNESFVKRHYGNEDPIGKRISMRGPNGPWIEIVGVVADSKYATLSERPTRIIYLPLAQNHVNGVWLVARAKGDAASIAARVGREVHAMDPSLPVAGTRTLSQLIGTSIYAARAGATLITAFGLLALVLAAVGLYGVLAYAVSRRTREFGLRMALGARARDVLRQVMGEGVSLVVIGATLGLVVALSLSHLLARFLYDVSTKDVATFVATPVVLLAVALVACVIPARRATRVDPIRALKEE